MMIEKICLKAFLLIIGTYRKFVSPLLPGCCRFYPSCSEYSRLSLLEHGVLNGTWLSFKRILRCNPMCAGGYDPVSKRSAERWETE